VVFFADLNFVVPGGSAGAESATGMKKHTLDRRYNSKENISLRTSGKKGAKRSKRSHPNAAAASVE
jgi:hypothetical protein